MERLPEGWDPLQMHEEIFEWHTHGPDPLLDAQVLCWKIVQDDRPLYVESCILWTQLEKADSDVRYRLWHLYRHPHHARITTWKVSVITDSAVPSNRSFSSPPSSDDVLDFINDTRWLRSLDDSFELLGGAVCRDAWKDVTGSSFPDDRLHLLFKDKTSEM